MAFLKTFTMPLPLQGAQQWPNDFDMQEYVINKQVNAYKNLHQQ